MKLKTAFLVMNLTAFIFQTSFCQTNINENDFKTIEIKGLDSLAEFHSHSADDKGLELGEVQVTWMQMDLFDDNSCYEFWARSKYSNQNDGGFIDCGLEKTFVKAQYKWINDSTLHIILSNKNKDNIYKCELGWKSDHSRYIKTLE